MSNRDALVCLFHNLGGIRWRKKDYWDLEVPISKWFGVKIDEAAHVKCINLNDNGMEGSLPFQHDYDLARLKYLKDLQELSLASNRINGVLPSGIHLLQNLQTLNLAWNKLRGMNISSRLSSSSSSCCCCCCCCCCCFSCSSCSSCSFIILN